VPHAVTPITVDRLTHLTLVSVHRPGEGTATYETKLSAV